MFCFKIALVLLMIGFLSFIWKTGKLTALLRFVCSLLFHSGVAEWSFLGDRELFTHVRQHI